MAAQEVNALLHHAGLIDGEPGAWRLTEKGAPYANVTVHGRGTGGYSFMNPSWGVTAWDESVLGLLDLSDDAKQRARQAVTDRRRAMTAARKAATAAADRAFLEAVDARPTQRVQASRRGAGTTKTAAALVGLTAAYGLYRTRRRRLNQAASRRTEELSPKSDPDDDSMFGDDSRHADAT
jgi:hypothetical protein